MTQIATIKAAQLQARKARDTTVASALTTVIGEVETLAKNKGNPEATDEQVIATLKKFLKNILDTARIAKGAGDLVNEEKAKAEAVIYERFLPQQLSEDQIQKIITAQLEDFPAHKIGDIIKHFKVVYEGQYDGGLVSKLAKEAL